MGTGAEEWMDKEVYEQIPSTTEIFSTTCVFRPSFVCLLAPECSFPLGVGRTVPEGLKVYGKKKQEKSL